MDNLGRLIRWLEAHDPYAIVVLHCPGTAAPRVGGRGLAVAWDQHLGVLDPSVLAELLAAGASAVHIAACSACQKADTPSHLGARFASGYVLPYTPPRRRPLRRGTQLSLTAIPLPRRALFAPIHGPIRGRDADPFRAFAAWHRLATAGVVPLPAVARWDGTTPLADADVDALHAIRCAACSDGLAHCPNGATDARTIRATYSTLCRACRTAIHYCTQHRAGETTAARALDVVEQTADQNTVPCAKCGAPHPKEEGPLCQFCAYRAAHPLQAAVPAAVLAQFPPEVRAKLTATD
ncbi:hypothetical protein [Neoactinobaculum massilliense]|uniref:hypothetical protein n=1 Tax=Neoactinobaculum massilliense TaxID=2364794 RepID=UPI000F52A4F9|nr:hypothetical protein [Neoactinobaculum massilliense]